jgi:hypothetical protein
MRLGYDEYDGEYEDPADAEADRRVLGWGGAANPNTADGQIQNIAAFAAAASAATGWRRTAARVAAWLVLGFIACYVLVVFLTAVRVF